MNRLTLGVATLAGPDCLQHLHGLPAFPARPWGMPAVVAAESPIRPVSDHWKNQVPATLCRQLALGSVQRLPSLRSLRWRPSSCAWHGPDLSTDLLDGMLSSSRITWMMVRRSPLLRAGPHRGAERTRPGAQAASMLRASSSCRGPCTGSPSTSQPGLEILFDVETGTAPSPPVTTSEGRHILRGREGSRQAPRHRPDARHTIESAVLSWLSLP